MTSSGEEETVPCETCGASTTFTGTRRCNNCWEVERRLGAYLREPNGLEFVSKMVAALDSNFVVQISHSTFSTFGSCHCNLCYEVQSRLSQYLYSANGRELVLLAARAVRNVQPTENLVLLERDWSLSTSSCRWIVVGVFDLFDGVGAERLRRDRNEQLRLKHVAPHFFVRVVMTDARVGDVYLHQGTINGTDWENLNTDANDLNYRKVRWSKISPPHPEEEG